MVSTKYLTIMTVFSIIIIILLLNSVKSDDVSKTQNVTSLQNFKESLTKMIKEQSVKIGDVLKKIQTNSQWVLQKINNMNEKKPPGKMKKNKKYVMEESNQIESPIKKEYEVSRSFSHYGSTGYGTSGYAYPTYHHHSIGLDPLNIVVSMSLISFLIQAFQGLLVRTRLPTPVVEAKSFTLPDKMRKFEKKNFKKEYYKARLRKPIPYLKWDTKNE